MPGSLSIRYAPRSPMKSLRTLLRTPRSSRLLRRGVAPVGMALAGTLLLFAIAPASRPDELGVGPTVAEAQQRARVFITQARLPRNLSERRLISFVRGHNARRLDENDEGPLDERYWFAQMVTSFSRPVGDLEFQVLFHDITDRGERRFVSPALTTLVNDRDQKTFVQRLRLPRPQFRPNRRYELSIVVRRETVGTATFELRGEVRQNSGVVDFTGDMSDMGGGMNKPAPFALPFR